MKLLLINGSPKGEGSNTLRLAKAFIEGYRSRYPDAEVTALNVAGLDIKPCKGCFACWNKTPGKCVIADGMRDVLERIIHADVLVWSFPLYYFGVPGALKNLIDRQLPMSMPFMVDRADGVGSGSHPSRYDLSAQKRVIISTCGFYSAEKNYDSVTGMFDHMYGKDNYETIFCGQGELFRVKELSARTDEYLGLVREAGEQYAGGGISPATKAGLAELLYPKEVFEKMADASWGVDKESGGKEDESLSFTRQMAALYNKDSFDGTERVLEMSYTDVGKTYQIILGSDGCEVTETTERKYTTRVETPLTVWKQIARGEMRGDAALMEGKYRVLGDFSLMINWGRFFGSASGSKAAEKAVDRRREKVLKKPSLFLMLVPWITLWIAVAVTPVAGGLITMGVCALLPLLTLRREKNVYDSLSLSIPAALGILAVVTHNGPIACIIGYAAFGLMWLISCFTKEPLCAAYVKYNYGGDDALNNPMFMRTNVILAAAWGVLYILTAVWTYLLIGSRFGDCTVFINNTAPVLMGIFTAWFERWHPAHVASRGSKGKRS